MYPGVLCGAVLVLLAPGFSSWLYNAPQLTDPLRLMSLYFIAVAWRPWPSRWQSAVSAHCCCCIRVGNHCHDERVHDCLLPLFPRFLGVIYGILLGRLLLTGPATACIRSCGPGPSWIGRQWGNVRVHQIRYAVKHSDVDLTQLTNDIPAPVQSSLLGVYGLGNNIAAPVESFVIKISQMCSFHAVRNATAPIRALMRPRITLRTSRYLRA